MRIFEMFCANDLFTLILNDNDKDCDIRKEYAILVVLIKGIPVFKILSYIQSL